MGESMDSINRRRFFGQAAAGLAALSTLDMAASAELVYKPSDWKLAEFQKLLAHPAHVKQVYDVANIENGNFLIHICNSLNGLHFGFGIAEASIQIVSATHGPSNLVNYDDSIWEKYQIGEWLKINDPKTGKPATRNIYYASNAGDPPVYASQDPNDMTSRYHDTSIQALQRRGVRFLSCHTATEAQASELIAHNHLTQKREEVVQDLQSHTVPGVLIVPSMVAAIALLQSQGRFTYITI
jgi:intracellular sulfur oxidation DsrE/DsrF family protein